jgi:hypothetical protein
VYTTLVSSARAGTVGIDDFKNELLRSSSEPTLIEAELTLRDSAVTSSMS